MGVGFFFSLLFIALLFRCSSPQQPNTDGFFVSDFLQKMGLSLPSSPVCSWKWVTCDAQHDKVTSFIASGLGLSGPIPENTIGKLSRLETLDLSNNSISGLASDFWGVGGTIKNLNLSRNLINGSLPNNIGNFGFLENLDLSFNGFSGDIPDALGALSRLQHLSLSHNGFEGRIPDSISGCRGIASIDLSSNRLNGSLTNSVTHLERLVDLNLANNGIHGRVPDLSELKSLSMLNLSSNRFQDSPTNAFRAPLQVVDLSKNQFQGYITQVKSGSGFNLSNLVLLDLAENELSGDFLVLREARALRYLNLAGNSFSHREFPSDIGNASNLEYLNMSKTGIAGRIPVELSRLTNLRTLDLSHNHLSGDIPRLSIAALQVIDLSHNNLTGEIPPSLQQKLPELLKFNFSYNNLTFCASKFRLETLKSAFIGSSSDCPIAANPGVLRRRSSTENKRRSTLKLALAIALSAFFSLVGLFCLAFFACRRRTHLWTVKQPTYKEEQNISGPFSFETDSTTWVADVKLATSVPVVIFEKPLLNFTFADLLSATSHFDRGTLLAEGRFGPVYRGFLPGGIHVAVKVLVHGSSSGVAEQDAARELERLGRIKHSNLVPLVGYCLAGDQRIAIYDYMENGNLQNLLHDLPLGVQTTEDWSTDTWEDDNDGGGVRSAASEGLTSWRFRHKIALGAARALAFLHHGCFPLIIHRDVKASSVYLDSQLEPRLSDFGLAKIVGGEVSRGSPGYAPPEFAQSEACEANVKSDVYAFGVVLFELVTGREPVERELNLVEWVRGLARGNRLAEAIDPKIQGTGAEAQMVEALRIGYLCTAESPLKRPSMQQIVGLLKDIGSASADSVS
ncbi:putative LRR receptor-like serine/threonine-protein kinase [Acorus gramineus]|uniref:LRR receptor-like serine/threonine-protein kinase n=1 Tax=Acorus gramineus TaxID=55184 RepID=A0AAV9AVP1_ACOGR|nr:putative LRR receptor-like serine/threonine-protein kinase [Acorus gramineus]